MCTLILGRDVLAPGVTILAANRDEDPERPSLPPHVLSESPRVVGGSDQRSGGTWLAVRRDAAVAMLNRRPASGFVLPEHPRSRGLLALDVALVEAKDFALSSLARARAERLLEEAPYAPFSLVFASARDAWLLAWDGAVRSIPIPPGWHVLTHADLDEASEPRTGRLLAALAGFQPRDGAATESRLIELLALHDPPAVCLHEGPMPTISYALVILRPDGARYLHGDGRPCTTPPRDWSGLLEDS